MLKKIIYGLVISCIANANTYGATEVSQDVSIIDLIVNGTEYQNKQVRVVGYVNLRFEGDAIYLHKDDFEYNIKKNSLWLDIDETQSREWEKHNPSYAIIEGVFNNNNKGHFDMFAGSIKVKEIHPWLSRESREQSRAKKIEELKKSH